MTTARDTWKSNSEPYNQFPVPGEMVCWGLLSQGNLCYRKGFSNFHPLLLSPRISVVIVQGFEKETQSGQEKGPQKVWGSRHQCENSVYNSRWAILCHLASLVGGVREVTHESASLDPSFITTLTEINDTALICPFTVDIQIIKSRGQPRAIIERPRRLWMYRFLCSHTWFWLNSICYRNECVVSVPWCIYRCLLIPTENAFFK